MWKKPNASHSHHIWKRFNWFCWPCFVSRCVKSVAHTKVAKEPITCENENFTCGDFHSRLKEAKMLVKMFGSNYCSFTFKNVIHMCQLLICEPLILFPRLQHMWEKKANCKFILFVNVSRSHATLIPHCDFWHLKRQAQRTHRTERQACGW